MSLTVDSVVNVSLNVTPTGISKGDFGKIALLTQEPGTAFPDNMFIEAQVIGDVGKYFDVSSETYKAASVMFQQSPRPSSLIIGYWGNVDESAETPVRLSLTKALANFHQGYQRWYVVRPIPVSGSLSGEEIVELSTAVGTYKQKKCSYTTLLSEHLVYSNSNPFFTVAGLGLDNMFAQFDKGNQKYADISAMARALSVKWSGNRTTITLKFKQEPGVVPNTDLGPTEAALCRALGINFYTYYDTFAMLAEGTCVSVGGKRFWDEVHGLDWLCNAIQSYVFNTLATSPTKIPQTDKGQSRLVAAAEMGCEQGVTNGFLAPGIWYGDEFGNLSYGDRLDQGFYIYMPPVDDQDLVDRENREATVMQVAVKLAGAIHSADIIINFTR